MGDESHNPFPLEQEPRHNPWIEILAENYNELGDELEEIAERTTDIDTEQELREVISDVRELAEHYEGHND